MKIFNTMRENTPIASFRFKRYYIKETSLSFNGQKPSPELGLHIDASASLDSSVAELTLDVAVQDKGENLLVKVVMVGLFDYDNCDIDLLKSFVAQNAPAILFPYVRAYVGNMTALGGIEPIIMPTVNLVHLGEELLAHINEKD